MKSADDETTAIVLCDPNDRKGKLKCLGGSESDNWNNLLADQAARTVWLGYSDAETRERKYHGAITALVGIGPKDELEGMVAAQLVGAHNAAMECYRRAMHPDQSYEVKHQNLNQANKLSRTFAALLDTLNRHRGKGQQKVTVEHVHVHAGGQAVVGMMTSPGEGGRRNWRINPMQNNLPMHQSRRCGAWTRRRTRCQSPAMPNGRCRMHGGLSPGAPKGNKNALKHGLYTARAISERRETTQLLRAIRTLAVKIRQ